MGKHPREEDGTDRNEEFLQRWSRRKAAAKKSQDAEAEQDIEPAVPEPPSEPAPPPKTDADMPPLESIDESTDMRDFFSPDVSEKLRRLALRKLFHLPQFNIVDGLDDYDDDFTNFEALGDIVTADMRHQMELEKERLASARAEEVAENGIDEGDTRAQADESEEDATPVARADTDVEHEVTEHTADSDEQFDEELVENDDDHRNS